MLWGPSQRCVCEAGENDIRAEKPHCPRRKVVMQVLCFEIGIWKGNIGRNVDDIERSLFEMNW
jgi:hypothetical protein